MWRFHLEGDMSEIGMGFYGCRTEVALPNLPTVFNGFGVMDGNPDRCTDREQAYWQQKWQWTDVPKVTKKAFNCW